MNIQRPHVQLQTKNEIEQFELHLASVSRMLMAIPGVIGITLNGGLSRGYADHLSEIDVTLYLESAIYQVWQAGNSPVPYGICMVEDMLYDIKVVDFKAEQERAWESDALWDASYAKILYDPDDRIARLLREKLATFPQPQEAERELFSCWWYFQLAGDIWIHRGDALQGHFMFNQAVVSLIKTLFIANGEFVPHEKWLIHMSRTLTWTPDDWEGRLGQAMFTGKLTTRGLRQRQAVIEELWSDVDDHIRLQFPDLPVFVMQKTFYELLKMLVEKQTISLAAWQEKARLDMLNRTPFYEVARIENGNIVLDKERLLNMKPEDMYIWHFEILYQVVSTAL